MSRALIFGCVRRAECVCPLGGATPGAPCFNKYLQAIECVCPLGRATLAQHLRAPSTSYCWDIGRLARNRLAHS
eukprot:14862299-Alexandrium_andersonii.AAC.1